MRQFQIFVGIIFCLTSTGCSESIDSSGQDQVDSTESLTPRPLGGNAFSLLVDATDQEEWTRVHLQEGIIEDPDDWDLAFRRFSIRLNGGASGTGFALGQLVDADGLGAIDIVPSDGWSTDGEAVSELVMSQWYDYDIDTHILTPVSGVWLLRSGDGLRYYGLQILSYYDEAGDSGLYDINWTMLDAPENQPDMSPGTGGLPRSTDDPHSDVGGAEALGAEATAFGGSYGCDSGEPDNECDCALTEDECESIEGTWTGDCNCDD